MLQCEQQQSKLDPMRLRGLSFFARLSSVSPALNWNYFTFQDFAGNLGPVIPLFGYQPIPLPLYLVFMIVACHLSFPAEDLMVVFWSLGEMAKSKCEM